MRHRVAIGRTPDTSTAITSGDKTRRCQTSRSSTLCAYQIGALIGLARGTACEVRYVKPHGALYNQACRDDEIALGVYEAARCSSCRSSACRGAKWKSICRRLGVPFIPEGFADRRYRPDGSLVPRTEPDAFVHDPDEAVKQVEWLIREKGVRTVCVHGDNPEAVAFARAVREALLARGFALKPFA